MRWYRTVGLTVVLVGLAACDQFSPPVDPLAYDPLPDPAVDWRPLADAALEEADCPTLFELMFALAKTMDSEIVPYVTNALALDRCISDQSLYHQFFLPDWPDTFMSRSEDALLTYESVRNEVGVPGMRGADVHLYDRYGIELSADLQNLERHWVVRCEGPLGLWVRHPYDLRRDLAHIYEDESYLIPEWEERRAECYRQGIVLARAYGRLLESQSHVQAREVVATTVERLQIDLDRLR